MYNLVWAPEAMKPKMAQVLLLKNKVAKCVKYVESRISQWKWFSWLFFPLKVNR
jgi:hypothetical protein